MILKEMELDAEIIRSVCQVVREILLAYHFNQEQHAAYLIGCGHVLQDIGKEFFTSKDHPAFNAAKADYDKRVKN